MRIFNVGAWENLSHMVKSDGMSHERGGALRWECAGRNSCFNWRSVVGSVATETSASLPFGSNDVGAYVM